MTATPTLTAPTAEAKVPTSRAAKVADAVRSWQSQLLNLTANNRLLYYKDQENATLDLTAGDPAVLDRLLARQSVTLNALVGDRGPDNLAKRGTTIRKKATENYEERGVQTLLFTWGIATWQVDGAGGKSAPRAPVLLFPAELRATGTQEQGNHLQITGDATVNPTLLHYLTTTFGPTIDTTDIATLPGIDGDIDTRSEVATILRWLEQSLRAVPGLVLTDERHMSNFSYTKMAMVEDLDALGELLLTNNIVAGIAGDTQAQQAINANIGDEPLPPDLIAPADEFLTHDADSSQNFAINAALAGRSLVVEGPPGTGKSQTIANLIGASIARGRRVLFVAEKRAAIDAVMDRLQNVGLSDIVLDLHKDTLTRNKQMAALQRLRACHVSTRAAAQPDALALVEVRGLLTASNLAINESRSPWHRSLVDLYGQLLALGSPGAPRSRLVGNAILAVSDSRMRSLCRVAGEWASAGGTTLPHQSSPWRHCTRRSVSDIEELFGTLTRLAQVLIPDMLRELHACCPSFPVGPSLSLQQCWGIFTLADHATVTTEHLLDEVYADDLDMVIANLAPAHRGPVRRALAWATSGTYRGAVRYARSRSVGAYDSQPRSLYDALFKARQLKMGWTACGGDGNPRAAPNLANIRPILDELSATVHALTSTFQQDLNSLTLSQMQSWAGFVLDDRATALLIPTMDAATGELHDAGFASLLRELIDRQVSASGCQHAVEWCWALSIVDHVMSHDPRTRGLGREQQGSASGAFIALDRRHIASTAPRIRRLAAEAAINAENHYPQETMALNAAVGRKRGGPSLRRVVESAPHVIGALAPCWTMSPLLVSQILPATGPAFFDLVIFDEASQILPADAIPALARARQAVVAGDSKQLPPTTFFAAGAPPPPTAAVAAGATNGVVGFESLLDVMKVFLAPKTLLWHYRSTDERLIAFSNAELYGKRLISFPGVSDTPVITHTVVDPTGGVLNDASSRAEVHAVVELVLQHAAEREDQSLGVITLGVPHKTRIDEALLAARAFRPELDDFFAGEHTREPFFVKNLERVQGDERDAIILSIGYGKGADGIIRYNFGPVNQEGGERRLNVAITRAKRALTLVSTFTADEMDERKCLTTGMAMMRRYTRFAARGGELDRTSRTAAEINPFEQDIFDALTCRGMSLEAQYGVSGYRIDFVARNPNHTGRFVLAIECDGASYHSAESARDRDRLRQEHLERLGWRFHRIWSTEWFRNKPAEVERAWDALEHAVADAETAGPAATACPAEARASEGPMPVRPVRPNVLTRLPIEAYSPDDIVRVIDWVSSDGVLRSREEMLREVMRFLGFNRKGARIVGCLGRVIAGRMP